MPDVLFRLPDGSELGFEAPDGVSLMAAATGWGVPGIAGECGGSMVCATCHVWVDPAWAGRLAAPSADEQSRLQELPDDVRRPNSRLACRIRLDAALQGLAVEVPG